MDVLHGYGVRLLLLIRRLLIWLLLLLLVWLWLRLLLELRLELLLWWQWWQRLRLRLLLMLLVLLLLLVVQLIDLFLGQRLLNLLHLLDWRLLLCLLWLHVDIAPHGRGRKLLGLHLHGAKDDAVCIRA